MKRLQLHENDVARPLFADVAAWNVYLTAVLHNDSPGRVYVDDPAAPRSGFAVSLDGAYLAGDADNHAFNSALRDELAATLLAGDRVNAADPTLTVCVDSSDWEPALADILGEWRWPPIWGQNHYYRFDSPRLNWRDALPSGYDIVRLDAALLQQQGNRLPQNVTDAIRIGWQNQRNFLENDFGFAARHGNDIVCWCLADVTTGDKCEIGIETIAAQRRRGLATAVTAATVAYCQQQGFTHIGWHCSADNTGSIKTAVNVGFQLAHTYHTYTFHYDEAQHFAELGKLYFFADMAVEAADALDLALELDEQSPDYVYLLAARVEAKLGNGRYALDLLQTAVDAGFGDAALLNSLPEFTPLRRQSAWQQLLATLREKIDERDA